MPLWLHRSSLLVLHDATPSRRPFDFHRALPGYAPTPLRELPALAERCGAARLWVKDEGERFGLPAFKILGASWAVCSLLAERLGAPELAADLPALRARLGGSPALVAATDGNHGRAVARMAALLGLPARIFLPAGPAPARLAAIAGEGAQVEVVDGSYDETVARAATVAAESGGLLVQDTGFPGYEEIPERIAEGYATLFWEIEEQLASLGAEPPDIVFVPVGVGALAQAAVVHWKRPAAGGRTRVFGVEPYGAACVHAALAEGAIVSLEYRQESVMAGLNCGTASTTAWPWLRRGLDGVVRVLDARAEQAMQELAAEGVVAGETGAAAMAGLYDLAVLGALAMAAGRPRPIVLLLSTEGATDPESWERIVGRPPTRAASAAASPPATAEPSPSPPAPQRPDAPADGEPGLVAAVVAGDAATVAALLAAGVPAGSQDAGWSALGAAVDTHQLAIIDLLLRHGADAGEAHPSAGSLLHRVATDDPTRPTTSIIVRRLVKHGADLERRGAAGATPLLAAVRAAAGRRAVEPRRETPELPPAAALEGDSFPDELDRWLDEPDFGAVAPPADPPVFAAHPHSVIVTLLEFGAAVLACDAAGNGAVSIALAAGDEELAAELVERGADGRGLASVRLLRAAGEGWEEEVDRQLAAGADPNHLAERGMTPLCLAAVGGHLGVVRRLLAAGADPTRPEDDAPDGAFTPLLHAVYGGHLEMARDLLAAGADPHAPGPIGQRLLDYAKRGAAEGNAPQQPWDEVVALVRAALADGPPCVRLEPLAAPPAWIAELPAGEPLGGGVTWRRATVGALELIESSPLPSPPADWDGVLAVARRHGYGAVLAGWSLDFVEPPVSRAAAAVAAVDAAAGRAWLQAEVARCPEAARAERRHLAAEGVLAELDDPLATLETAAIPRPGAPLALQPGTAHLVLVSGPPELVAAIYELAQPDFPPAALASVLAAWREDLGAALASFHPDRVEVVLPAPLADDGEVRRRAQELLAFCTDLAEDPVGILAMTAARLWSFWWD